MKCKHAHFFFFQLSPRWTSGIQVGYPDQSGLNTECDGRRAINLTQGGPLIAPISSPSLGFQDGNFYTMFLICRLWSGKEGTYEFLSSVQKKKT